MMKTPERLYVDVHVLQTVPPSCINRDDTGSPKTAQYGGVTRARVSSQCWKRAVRLTFNDLIPAEKLGYRTKRIVKMVADELQKTGFDGDMEKAATALLKTAGLDIKSAEKGTDALFFMSRAQAKALAVLAKDMPDLLGKKPGREQKALAQKALTEQPGIDVALFGRMVASDPSLNTDACAQVAHSISTHKVSTEYDYFTAVDDLSPKDNAGAGHIGTVEYNSATLYRYATVAVHALHETLQGDTNAAVAAFVRAFVTSMPTGKQNTFANRTLPDAVMVTLREDQPINMAGAFEEPVTTGEGGYLTASAHKLAEYAQGVYQDFAGNPLLAYTSGKQLQGMGVNLPFPQLVERLSGELEARLAKDDDVV